MRSIFFFVIFGDKLVIDRSLTEKDNEDIYEYIIEKCYERPDYLFKQTYFKRRPKEQLLIAFNKMFFNKFDNRFPEFANRKSNSETILLPEEYVGNMMVFRTFDKISYALVMELNGPVHVSDTVRSL